jgi:hypothetical protein
MAFSRAASCDPKKCGDENRSLIQHGAGRPKKMPLMEVKCPTDNATPTSGRGPKLLAIRDGASQDLSTLRRLFEEQLAGAAALRSKSTSSYQQVHISSGLEKR